MNATKKAPKEPHELREQAYSLIRSALGDGDEGRPASGEKQSELKDLIAELTTRLESALTRGEDVDEELAQEIQNRESYEEDAKRDGESEGLAKALEIVQDVEREVITLAEARDRIQRLEG